MLAVEDTTRGLAFTVAPEAGAELSSLRVRHQDRWVETLYRADLQDQPCDGWRGRAPWLWPAVGRTFTPAVLAEVARTGDDPAEGEYVLDGQSYPLPTHGFAMRRAWDVVDADARQVRCRLTDDADTRRQYPFGFELTTWFRIEADSLVIDFSVRAAGDNPPAMPFAVGNHITLALPMGSDAAFGQCEVFSPVAHELVLTPESLLAGTTRPIALAEGRRLADTRLHNMVLSGMSEPDAWISVWCPGGLGLRVSQRVTAGRSFAPSVDHWYDVFYGDAELGLFCPEPWIGGPNALNTGQGLVAVPPGEMFTWQFRATPFDRRDAVPGRA